MLRLSLGVVLSVFCLWLTARGTELEGTWTILAGVEWPLALGAVVLVMMATVVRAWRWAILLGSRSPALDRLWSIVLIGQAVNIAIPARMGELSRVALVARSLRDRELQVAASIALEKLLDAAVFAALLVWLSAAVALPPWIDRAGQGFTLMLVVACLMLGLLLSLSQSLQRLAGRLPRWSIAGHVVDLGTQLRQALQGLDVLRSRGSLWRMQGASMLVWASAAAANYLTLLALDIDAPLAAPLLVLVVLQLGTAVPSSPGKVGVFQYLCVVALTPFAVEREAAVGYGVLLHAIAYGPPLLIGTGLLAWELARDGQVRAAAHEPPPAKLPDITRS